MINETDRIAIGGDRVSFGGKFIQIVSRAFRNKVTGKEGVWECVQRKNTHGRIVAVLPVTAEGNLILIESFRIPVKNWVIEPVAGLMDGGPEEEMLLAKREMLEEAGYESSQLEFLCAGSIGAGLSNDQMAFYVALNAQKVSEPKLEDEEDIKVISTPLCDAMGFLWRRSREGFLVDVKLFGTVALIRDKYPRLY
jgi:8-oxo-dGTP pyrophosphatase MutT (NUDIX family)